MSETKSFGQWLRHRRRELDLTQSALALQVGCAQITIRKLEADELRPSRQLAELLVARLGVPSSERPQYERLARLGSRDEPAFNNSIQDTQPYSVLAVPGSEGDHPNNLPAPLTSFIGRKVEIEDICQRLRRHRLVTLIGSGGTGKTRLALKVAERMLESFPDGVFQVELARLSDPDLIPQACMQALGILDQASLSKLKILNQFLKNKHFLLLLDNCEHMIAACAQLVNGLLSNCPGLTIMVTSREILAVPGESSYRVPSMQVPDLHELTSFDELVNVEAMQMFLERAALVSPGIPINEGNLKAVAQICQRLDGIPLAIELAAARAGVLNVEQIAARLDDRFHLLTGGLRTALPRHRTLRASIDWSFSLLDDDEKALFRRLSVFYGGCTLESIEGICGFDPLEPEKILDLLASLGNKSLLVVDLTAASETRYHLLETVRQYALEKLEDAREFNTVCDRHLSYFLAQAEEDDPRFLTKEAFILLQKVDTDLDNLRAALSWAFSKKDRPNAELGLRLVLALDTYLYTQGLEAEAGQWHQRGLPYYPVENEQSAVIRIFSCICAGHYSDLIEQKQNFLQESITLARKFQLRLFLGVALAIFCDSASKYRRQFPTGEYFRGVDIQADIGECLDIAREDDGDQSAAASFLRGLIFWVTGAVCQDEGDFTQALRLYEQASALFVAKGNVVYEYHAANSLGNLAIVSHDSAAARRYLNRAQELALRFNSHHYLNQVNMSHGRLGYINQDFDQVVSRFQDAQSYFTRRGDEPGINYARLWQGIAFLHLEQFAQAASFFRKSNSWALENHDQYTVFSSLLGLAGVAVHSGHPDQAARLIGFFEEHLKTIAPPLRWGEWSWFEKEELNWHTSALKNLLSLADLVNLRAEGRKLTLAQAISEAYMN